MPKKPWSTVAVPRQPDSGYIPPEVRNNIRTHDFDFDWRFGYRIRNGIIEYKPHTGVPPMVIKGGRVVRLQLPPGYTQDWMPYEGIGVPFKTKNGKKVSLLKPGERILEIKAAAQNLVVVTTHGEYQYKVTGSKHPTGWEKKLGKPFKMEAEKVDGARSSSLSAGLGNRPHIRYQDIDKRDRIDKIEDGNKLSQQVGFVLISGVLSPDGTCFLGTDTGLTNTYAKGVRLPKLDDEENGKSYILKGENHGQAGSTLVVCGRDKYQRRRYYWMNYDYEIAGGCPGLKYSLNLNEPNQIKEPLAPDGVIKLGDGTRYISRESHGWHEIHLNGITDPEQLSSNISVYTTGAGNAERELRIFTKDKTGYWYKKIYDDKWEFHRIDERFLHGTLPDDKVRYYDHSPPSVLKNYTVFANPAMGMGNHAGIKMELLNFHRLTPPGEHSTIRVWHNGDYADIRFHVADGWTPTFFEQEHILRGSSAGMSKSLRGTVIIEDSPALHTNPALRDFVMRTFGRHHYQTGTLRVIADDENISITSDDRSLRLNCERKLSQQEFDNTFYRKIALAPELNYYANKSYSLNDLILLKELNQQALAYLNKIYHHIRHHNIYFIPMSYGLRAIIPFVKCLAEILMAVGIKVTHHLHPVFDKAFKDCDELMHAASIINREALKKSLFHNNDSYETAVSILKNRIEQLSMAIDIRREQSSGPRTVFRPSQWSTGQRVDTYCPPCQPQTFRPVSCRGC